MRINKRIATYRKKPPLFHIFFLFILDMNLQNVYRTFSKCDFSEFYLKLKMVYFQLEQSINQLILIDDFIIVDL
jgi:hypothetical protein